jgi:hypothetical protein
MPVILGASNESGPLCRATINRIEAETGVPHCHCAALCQPPLLWLDVTRDEVELQRELGLSTVMQRRPHPDSNGVGCSSNKSLQKPDR